MSKEELKKIENTFFNNIKKNIPDFTISAKNNVLVIVIRSLATYIYSLIKKSDKSVSTLTNINDGDLDYRASFYGISRRLATKSQGLIIGKGEINTVIPTGTFFVDGNYISTEEAKIEEKQVIGQMSVDSEGIGLWNLPNNFIPLDYNLVVIINEISYNVKVTESLPNSLKVQFQGDNFPEVASDYVATSLINLALIKVESLAVGREQNLEPNIQFDFNQIIEGLDPSLNISPQGLTGGQDEESDVSLSKRMSLQRSQYVTSTSFDGIKLYFLTNIPDVTRVFPFRKTETDPAKIYCVYENRDNILSTNDDILKQKELYNQITNIGASVDIDIVFPDLELVEIEISYDSIVPSTVEMQAAIKDTINLFFRNENSVGKKFLKNDLLLYLLANCIDVNNQSLLAINLVCEDTDLTNSQLGVVKYVN